MPTDPTIASASASPNQTPADTDLALRRIADVFANRESTPDEIMKALRSWSHLILARRIQATLEGEMPSRAANEGDIVDVVQLSPAARLRQAS